MNGRSQPQRVHLVWAKTRGGQYLFAGFAKTLKLAMKMRDHMRYSGDGDIEDVKISTYPVYEDFATFLEDQIRREAQNWRQIDEEWEAL